MAKKIAFTFIVVIIVMICFAGCTEKDIEPLRVCVDLEYVYGGDEENRFLRQDVNHLLITRMLEAGKQKGIEVPRDFEIEYLPISGSEREVALQRVRTEIMAGEGPDVFIAACNAKSQYVEGLFPMPEKAMELSLFLPLDKYMEDSQFAEWNRMNSVVLEAGRNEEGQQIIPLCYTIPVAVFRAEDVKHTPSKELTWMDMLNSEDISFTAAAVWTDSMMGALQEGAPFLTARVPMTEFVLGDIADYKDEELLFTEEELKQRVNEIYSLGQRYEAGEFNAAPIHYVGYLGQKFDLPQFGLENDPRNNIQHSETYTLIPLYSDDGGVTAEISVYAAINRNTKNPEDAFRVLDYLSSFKAQQCERIYEYCYEIGSNGGMSANIPMYDELMSKDYRVYKLNSMKDVSVDAWYLSDENYAQLCAVRGQITYVRFRDTLDFELRKLYDEYLYVADDEIERDEIISKYYRRMQQILRE